MKNVREDKLIQYFKDEMFDSKGRFCSPKASLSYHKKNIEAFVFLQNGLESGKSISESIYCLINGINERPSCEFCSSKCDYVAFWQGYKKTCGKQQCLKSGYGKNPHIPTAQERKEISERMSKNNPMLTVKP